MKIQEPKYRSGTGETINKLAKELGLPYNERMQDWSYEVANPNDIEKYLNHYNKLSDDDEKFVLMEILIQATNDQLEIKKFLDYWKETKLRLIDNFDLHEYTIYYWACFDNEELEDCWIVTPYMRELWLKQNEEKS